MNNGDDIHNLLKTLGHDAGLYQDLAKYNATRAALRRAAMGRPSEPAIPAAPVQAAPSPATTPQPTPRDEPAALSAILHRLSSPNEPRAAQGHRSAPATPGSTPAAPAPQPARLDRLFGRLATRPLSTPDR